MKINKHKNKALQSILNESKVNYKGRSIKMQPQAQNNAQNKNLELNESHNEKVKDKNGRDFSIWTECSGGSSTQSDYIKIAYLNDNWMDDNDKIIKDNLLGYLEYSVSDDNEDKAYVQMIEIKDSERRKGIASELIKSLQKEYKDIDYGYTTKDGTELLKGLGIREKLLPNDNDVKIYYFKSPYDAKNFLLNQKEPQRVYIDKQLGIYLIGDMYDTTHQYMIDNAKAQFLLGKYYDWSDYNDNQLSLIYVPNGSDFDESSDAIGDYYDHKYTYDDFIMYDRYHDFDNFELSDILGKHISQEAKLTNSNGYNVQDRYKFESLKEGNNYGYHAGDLGKSEQRERQTGGRGTGHFGTGTYFVGNPEKIKGYNDYQYGKGEAPHHIVDFSSYNLYKPSSNSYGYKLHDTLSNLNNGYAYYLKHSDDYDWFISKGISGDDPSDFELKDVPEIVSHLNNLLMSYDNIQLPNNINWETIESEYDKDWDTLYDKYKSMGYKYSDAFDKVDDELNNNPIYKEKNRVVREIIGNIKKELDYDILSKYKKMNKLSDRLFSALEGRHSKEEIQNALNEVNKHLNDKTGDSLSTIFMKALGYEGIDTRHLNKDSEGLSGLDNVGYGSVIYDVKPETIVEQHLNKSINESAPTKVGKAYKVFRIKNGKLYPPMVANSGGKDTPIGVWVDAEEGEFAGNSKTGRPQVKRANNAGVLAYRPGWHLGDIPRAKQFDRLNKETGEYEFPKDFIWAECEYAMDIDYQQEADEQGYMRTKVGDDGNITTYKSDKYQHSLAGLKKLPDKGYYKYRTNPNPDTVPWVITGQMKVNRLLDDFEVNEILKKNNIAPIHRQGGDKTLKELGLNESLKLNEAYAMSDRIRKLIDEAYDYCRQAGWDFDNPQTFKSNMLVNYPLRISIGNETARRLGQARYPKNDITEIVLAPQIDKFEKDESILSVILHELGHIIAFDDDWDRGYVKYSNKYKQTMLVKPAYKKRLSHHGKRWQDVVAKLSQVSGIPLQRLTNAEDTAEWQDINKDKYKYFFECPRCHSKLKYTRETDFVRTYNDTRQDGSPYWWCGKCEKETGEKIKYVKLDKEN